MTGTRPGLPQESTRPGEHPDRQPELTLGGKPSGLRNPTKAIRGLGAAALTMEALVLLLLLAPLRMLQGRISPAQLTVVIGGAVLAVLLTGLLRHKWTWWAGSAFQILLILSGLLHWTIAAVGVVFGLVWIYVLYVRRKVLM